MCLLNRSVYPPGKRTLFGKNSELCFIPSQWLAASAVGHSIFYRLFFLLSFFFLSLSLFPQRRGSRGGVDQVLCQGFAEGCGRARHLLVMGEPFPQGLEARQADRVRTKYTTTQFTYTADRQ